MLPKFGHDDNWNWSCDQFQLSSRPTPIVIVTKFWWHLPKIGHATNSNNHRDQLLVIFTKNWLRWQLELVTWPNFGKIYQRLVIRPITIVIKTKFWQILPKFGHPTNSNCHRDQFLVNVTKIWSRDQFLVKFTKNKKPDRKGQNQL